MSIYDPMEKVESEKLRVVAFILCTFFGGLGIHRMYVGKVGSGIAQLLLTLSVIGAIVSAPWVLVDWIMILAGSFKDSAGYKIIKWSN